MREGDESCPRAKKITSLLYHGNFELSQEFMKACGFRGLFDPHSAEWNSTKPEEKVNLVRKLRLAGFPVHDLQWAAYEIIVHTGHSPIDAALSVMEASSYYIEESLSSKAAAANEMYDALKRAIPESDGLNKHFYRDGPWEWIDQMKAALSKADGKET